MVDVDDTCSTKQVVSRWSRPAGFFPPPQTTPQWRGNNGRDNLARTNLVCFSWDSGACLLAGGPVDPLLLCYGPARPFFCPCEVFVGWFWGGVGSNVRSHPRRFFPMLLQHVCIGISEQAAQGCGKEQQSMYHAVYPRHCRSVVGGIGDGLCQYHTARKGCVWMPGYYGPVIQVGAPPMTLLPFQDEALWEYPTNTNSSRNTETLLQKAEIECGEVTGEGLGAEGSAACTRGSHGRFEHRLRHFVGWGDKMDGNRWHETLCNWQGRNSRRWWAGIYAGTGCGLDRPGT